MGYKLDIIKVLLKRANLAFKKCVRKEKVDNQVIKYAQVNNAGTTVVFDNGLGMGMKYWDEVFLEISKTNAVFAYNRKDDKILKNKTMSTDKVKLLRELLLKRGLKPPYLLVGHSLGGLYMQYYARKYPDEVLGLVLVDSTHPSDFLSSEKIPQKQKKQFVHIGNYMCPFVQKLLALPTVEIPVIALVAGHKRMLAQKEELKEMLKEMIKRGKSFPELYPNCKVKMVDTGHVVMFEKPEVVSEAILEMIKEHIK